MGVGARDDTGHVAPSHRSDFQPGDHLRVRRRLGYFHHGTYIGGGEVVEFGGGGAFDKSGSVVRKVPFGDFEDKGRVELVRHGKANAFGLPLPQADSSREEIVRRALWLVERAPQPYNLIGHNCEHIANWCATGYYIESHQTRNIFMAIIPIQGTLALYYSHRYGQGTMTRRLNAVALGFSLAVFTANTAYHWRIRRFWRDTLRDYPRRR